MGRGAERGEGGDRGREGEAVSGEYEYVDRVVN